MPNVLSEKTKTELVERIIDGTIHAEETDASKDHVGGIIGQIANGYICGLCGGRIEGKMWMLTDESKTSSGKEMKTNYYLDERCYQHAKNTDTAQFENFEVVSMSLN